MQPFVYKAILNKSTDKNKPFPQLELPLPSPFEKPLIRCPKLVDRYKFRYT